jgi:Dienelactone hydrolase family
VSIDRTRQALSPAQLSDTIGRTHIVSTQLTVAPPQGSGIVASEWVSILVDGQDMRTYVSQPETTGKVPGVNHGFNCDERPSYHAEAAIDAWARTRSWFQNYLQA